MFIPQSEYSVEEDVGELFIPIRRSGDVSRELMVICYTEQGNAIAEQRELACRVPISRFRRRGALKGALCCRVFHRH